MANVVPMIEIWMVSIVGTMSSRKNVADSSGGNRPVEKGPDMSSPLRAEEQAGLDLRDMPARGQRSSDDQNGQKVARFQRGASRAGPGIPGLDIGAARGHGYSDSTGDVSIPAYKSANTCSVTAAEGRSKAIRP